MKKILLFSVAIFLIVFLLACSKNGNEIKMLENNSDLSEGDSKVNSEKITVALVMKTLTNPFFIEMENGARLAESEFGINLIVKTGAQETSIDQQISIVEDMIAEKVDAIVIAPGGSTELIPILKKAQDSGIVVVNIDNQLDPELSEKLGLKNVPFISVDNVRGGYLSAKYISELLVSPTKVAIIEGITSAKNSSDRKEGAIKAFNESSNVSSIVTAVANWKIDESYQVTKELFKNNPDIGAVFCANDMMALGTIKYLEEENLSNVLVAGFDALSEAKEAIKSGSMEVTIDQQASQQGYAGVKCALDIINKTSVEQKQIVDVKVVTESNL